jgi:hypothetical protein
MFKGDKEFQILQGAHAVNITRNLRKKRAEGWELWGQIHHDMVLHEKSGAIEHFWYCLIFKDVKEDVPFTEKPAPPKPGDAT